MTRIPDLRVDFQPESSGWRFVTTCRGRGHILSARIQAAQLVLYDDSSLTGHTLETDISTSDV